MNPHERGSIRHTPPPQAATPYGARQVDPTAIRVQANPYEAESFHDIVAEQLRRAPWFAISIGLHAIAVLILLQIRRDPDVKPTSAQITVAPPEILEPIEPPPEEIPEVIPEDPEPVPVLDTPVVDTVVDTPVDDTNDDLAQDDAPFDKLSTENVIGIGGDPGGPSGRRGVRKVGAPRPTIETIHAALTWLSEHQDDDGKWDCDEFMRHDPPQDLCDGAGNPLHDVGVTALALLAFLGDDNTMARGKFKANVKRAALWLREQTDERGVIGQNSSKSQSYEQAIATLALVEAAGLSRSSVLRKTAQRAVDQICRSRNPYGTWQYYPRDGNNDTSVTGWMIFALKSAKQFGMRVDDEAFRYTTAWFEEVTDPSTGQCGYTKRGQASSRELGMAERFPVARTEALTAVGALSRIFLGQNPQSHPVILAAADTMLKKPPVWNEADGSIDLYYWYYGSYAMYQLGGRHWKKWKKSLEQALIKPQRRDGSASGSWNPSGAWGHSGGRVYSTAIGTLCLQAYYRYSSILR